MNVSSTAYNQYNQSYKENNSHTSQTSPVANYIPNKVNPAVGTSSNSMNSLDDRDNAIMNRVLSDKTLNDKWITQAILDRSFSRTIKINADGEIEITSNSNVKEEEKIIAMIDEFIQNKKMDNEIDNLGLLDVAQKFKELYTSDYLPMDFKA